MSDEDVLERIDRLAAEEHELYRLEGCGEASDADRARLKQLAVQLDQCWDLLHQRRARRAAGLDPDEASVRDPGIVEGYVR
ncbi:MAG: DUF2630 family protein [Actinomycetota bacterium]